VKAAVTLAFVTLVAVGACSSSAPRTRAAHAVGKPSAASASVPAVATTLVLPSDLRAGGTWARVPTTRPVVFLTFDAGADAAGAPKILAALHRAGIAATFFMTAQWALSYPDAARQIATSYAVGNHTYDHRDLTKLTDDAVRHEVTGAATVIRDVTGRDPAPLFRFPFGAENAHLVGLVNSLGYGDFGWTVDTLGWMGVSHGQSAAIAVNRVLSKVEPGEIVLMHVGAHPTDHSTIDADALPDIIAGLQARGYGFAALDQFLTPAELDSPSTTRAG